MPPTNILLGITVPNFGACVPTIGVELGVADGETSVDDYREQYGVK